MTAGQLRACTLATALLQIDADSIRTIVEHREDRPVELFPLDGRPHLVHVRVETTDVSSYQALLGEVTP